MHATRNQTLTPSLSGNKAVVFADVIGYSAMMARNELRTYQLWIKVLETVLKPKITEFHGELVKVVGDGILATFDTVDDVLDWVHSINLAMADLSDASEPGGLSMQMRFGVNYCPVILDGGDIYGDGVNIAQRLQEYAAPGGVVLSDTARRVMTREGGLQLRRLGNLTLRKRPAPVVAHQVYADGAIGARVPTADSGLPAIAVLPFANLGGTDEGNYFSDGLVEDIIVSLSSLRELFVVSRGSTLSLSPTEPIEAIAKVLDVDYVLTGSVRRSANRLRISANLIEVATRRNLFNETRSFPLEDLFEIQDIVVERVVAGIAPSVQRTQLERALRRRPESFSAYDSTLRGLDLMRPLEKSRFEGALEFFDKAVELDPRFSMPHAWAARWHSIRIGQGWSVDRRADATRAEELAARGIDCDRENALALATYGHIRSFAFCDIDTGSIYLERAREACPNSAIAWMLSSMTAIYFGDLDAALSFAMHAKKLSPLDPNLFYVYHCISLVHYCQGEYEEAVRWAKRSEAENKYFTSNLRGLIASLAATQQINEAVLVAERLMQIQPTFNLKNYRANLPICDEEMRDKIYRELRAAGIPD